MVRYISIYVSLKDVMIIVKLCVSPMNVAIAVYGIRN